MELKDGYKQTEVGVIPEDWLEPILEQLAIDQGGLVRGPFGGALKKEFFVPNGYKVYEQRNAIYSSANIGNYFINKEKFQELRRFEIRPGDFIVSCSGTIGKIYLIPEGAPKGIINQALLKIVLSETIDRDYFLHFFRWENFQLKIIDGTQGGAMKNLVGMNDFKKTIIPCPPTKTEQTAIAEALNDMDALITHLEKLIAKKCQIKQGAMQTLLNPFNEKGELKDGWEETPLKEISYMKGRIGWQGLKQSEFTDNNEEPFLITGMNFKDGKIRWDEVYHISEERFEIAKDIQLKIKDVLMTKDGTIGKLLYVDSIPYPGKATLNSHLLLFRPIGKSYVPKFLYYQLMSKSFKEHIEISKSGTTFFGLSQGAVGKYLFKHPSYTKQEEIANAFTTMDDELDQLRLKLNKTQKFKQGMMQSLLTGKIRLVKPQGGMT